MSAAIVLAERAAFIRSAFPKSFVTNREIVLPAPGCGEVLRVENQFVVTINANDGRFSPDLLIRHLCIDLRQGNSWSEIARSVIPNWSSYPDTNRELRLSFAA